MAVLQWIQDLRFSAAIAESDSIWWGYAWWLFVHALGMGLTAGIGFVVSAATDGTEREERDGTERQSFAFHHR